MRVAQLSWTEQTGWSSPVAPDPDVQLVLSFGSVAVLERRDVLEGARRFFPNAAFCGCSTAGEIEGTTVRDDSVLVTAVAFDHARVRVAMTNVEQDGGYEAGRSVASQLLAPDLRHVIVFSDGLHINGTALTHGLRSTLPKGVAATGGLSADGDRFERTVVLTDDGPKERVVSAVGLYGTRLQVGYGSLGGWDPFGPEREITRSQGNALYELDRRSALALYKEYLGHYAEGLPATGLLFPLSLRDPNDENGHRVVRTLLAVDEASGAMTFAGDLPRGHLAQLMKANFERLIEGAYSAALMSRRGTGSPPLALLISCVGRRLVLEQRIEEELEAVREVVGETTVLTGFYSYGEICPVAPGAGCELHNQTMTITTLDEV